MAHSFTKLITSQVRDTFKTLGHQENKLRRPNLKFNKEASAIELILSVPKNYEGRPKADNNLIQDVSESLNKKEKNLIFRLNTSIFLSEAIGSVAKHPDSFWKKCDLFESLEKQKILVEFSSPNICKPFHMGHLRSTILGNFLSNLHASLGHDVVRINYLGDWGTQFGMLNAGLEMQGVKDSDIERNPIQTLYESYVAANKAAETEPTIAARAREIFRKLEDGEQSPEIERWEKFRGYTVQELKSTYNRLNVHFDEYQWESMFGAREIRDVLDALRLGGILTSHEGREVASLDDGRKVTIVKSDGSSLYLTRDIAAAINRYQRHNFSKLFYIVDNSQSDHFSALRQLLRNLGHSWGMDGVHHIKFGRVRGMSSRKGNAVFLKDILDEARDRVEERQKQSATTRVDQEEDTSDVLAVTAVMVNDLKQRRQKDYEFNWDTALQMHGDSGIRLQYTHCRLWSLEDKNDIEPAAECDPELLSEPSALALVTEIARFDEVFERSCEELEACIIVNYLFSLSAAINQAFTQLPVKGQPESLASQRLLLFKCSRIVLAHGLKLLGVKPLQKM